MDTILYFQRAGGALKLKIRISATSVAAALITEDGVIGHAWVPLDEAWVSVRPDKDPAIDPLPDALHLRDTAIFVSKDEAQQILAALSRENEVTEKLSEWLGRKLFQPHRGEAA
jgi:hypothetical protein